MSRLTHMLHTESPYQQHLKTFLFIDIRITPYNLKLLHSRHVRIPIKILPVYSEVDAINTRMT